MTTLYLHHTAALNHLAEPGHPERADRIRVIERSLEQERFSALARELAPAAEIGTITLAHAESYVESVIDDLQRGGPCGRMSTRRYPLAPWRRCCTASVPPCRRSMKS